MNKTFAQLLLGFFLCPLGENAVQGRFNSNARRSRKFNHKEINGLPLFLVNEYYKMPKLYLMDDYDLCMDKDNLTIYCITTVIIKPNATLELWDYIDQFSRNRKKHFRHDRLQRGVCVNKCQVLLEDMDQDTLEDLYQPEFEYENEVGLTSR